MEQIKKWEELTLADNFIFQKVMRNQQLCCEILTEILGEKVEKVTYPQSEKAIDIRRESKSIRLDVYVSGKDNAVYNVEMQRSEQVHIPKRGRYYADLIDLDLLEKGMDYEELGKNFVIFICTYDYYKQGLYKYTFTNQCKDVDGLEYEDGTTKIVLNTKGNKGEVSEELKEFLNCVNGVYDSSEFSAKIKREVTNVKENLQNRREYMTLYLREQEIRKASLAEGRIEGRLQGKIEFAQEMGQEKEEIIQHLVKIEEMEEQEVKKLVERYWK